MNYTKAVSTSKIYDFWDTSDNIVGRIEEHNMTNYHCMPDLSPEEIRKISEAAVASVAAKKIVTNSKHITKSASLAGKVMAKQADVIKKLSGTGSSAVKINKAFTDSVLTQSKSRKYFQEAFIQVRKTIKV